MEHQTIQNLYQTGEEREEREERREAHRYTRDGGGSRDTRRSLEEYFL
jgi:hypothetical protein